MAAALEKLGVQHLVTYLRLLDADAWPQRVK
jgi:hypothetical protein